MLHLPQYHEILGEATGYYAMQVLPEHFLSSISLLKTHTPGSFEGSSGVSPAENCQSETCLIQLPVGHS